MNPQRKLSVVHEGQKRTPEERRQAALDEIEKEHRKHGVFRSNLPDACDPENTNENRVPHLSVDDVLRRTTPNLVGKK